MSLVLRDEGDRQMSRSFIPQQLRYTYPSTTGRIEWLRRGAAGHPRDQCQPFSLEKARSSSHNARRGGGILDVLLVWLQQGCWTLDDGQSEGEDEPEHKYSNSEWIRQRQRRTIVICPEERGRGREERQDPGDVVLLLGLVGAEAGAEGHLAVPHRGCVY